MVRDSTTKKFVAIPKNQKTPKMIEMEKKLGIKFEEDYINNYINNPNRSQREFAKRWGTNRGVIWNGNKANKSRIETPSWVERVGLSDKNITTNNKKLKIEGCEICGENQVNLDKAHWIADKDGGSTKFYNILKLCPNCHKRLDNKKDPTIIEQFRYTLFFRVMKKLSNEVETNEDKIRMVSIAKQIINRNLK